MPFEFRMEAERLLYVQALGHGSLADVLAAALRLEHYARAAPGTDILIDNLAYDYNPTMDELRQIVEVVRRSRAVLTGNIAVVTRSGVQYGVVRMFTALAEFAGLNVRPFRSVEDALAYLTHEQSPGS